MRRLFGGVATEVRAGGTIVGAMSPESIERGQLSGAVVNMRRHGGCVSWQEGMES